MSAWQFVKIFSVSDYRIKLKAVVTRLMPLTRLAISAAAPASRSVTSPRRNTSLFSVTTFTREDFTLLLTSNCERTLTVSQTSRAVIAGDTGAPELHRPPAYQRYVDLRQYWF